MDPLSLLGWILLTTLVTVCLCVLYLMAYLRATRLALEASHAAQQAAKHIDIPLEEAPPRLRQLVDQQAPELEQLGFKELLTGARLTLSQGRADSHYHIVVSPDKTAAFEMSHIRVGWYLCWVWPAQLPLSKWFGPVSLSMSLETMFTDHTTLITTTQREVGLNPLPVWHVIVVPPGTPAGEIWDRHKAELKRAVERDGKRCLLFESREAYFEKSRIQREQITQKTERLLQALYGDGCETDSENEG